MSEPETERGRFARLLFYVVVLMVGYLAFQVVGPFVAPLAWAGVFAMVLSPVHARLAARLKRPAVAASLTTLCAVLIIVGPAIGVLSILAVEVTTVVQRSQAGGYAIPASPDIDAWYARLREQTFIPLPTDLTSTVADALKTVATFVAARAGSVLQNVASFVFQLFVMLFGLFYFLRDGDAIVRVIRGLLPFGPDSRDRIMAQTYDLVVATVGSTFAVEITQGALTGLTLGLLGFHAPVFWGVMTAFLSLVPVVGAALVWGPAAMWFFATGDVVRGIVLVGVGVGVIGMADNILRPLLLSGRTTMHGLLVFISLLGGAAAFGFIGLVIGPVIMATFETLLGTVVQAEVPAAERAQPPAQPAPSPPDAAGPAAGPAKRDAV